MKTKILLVDDEVILRENIALILRQEGYEVVEASNGEEAFEKYLNDKFDILISDIEMPKMKGIELLEKISRIDPHLISIFITAYGSLETAIAALRLGASDYILKPIDFDELILKVKRLLEFRQLVIENQLYRRELQKQYSFDKIIGKSPAMQKVFEMIKSVAETNSSVLITGNSGTGKELVSRAIHYNGPRRDKPFVVVNCGAIPETLIESELFGHKKGSFTGAIKDKEGYFQAANGGTLFLDEISEMPLQSQVRLLRAIEQKEIIPVGSSTPIPVDVRIISATNKNLYKEVEEGRFRSDLYYRLNVVEIHLPSLSERVEDIPLLVEYFVDKYRKEMNKNIKGVDVDAMKALMNYTWRGEVRELENVIERAVIFCKGEYITINELPSYIISDRVPDLNLASEFKSLEIAVNEFEKEYIRKALAQNDYDKEKTARMLGVSTATLYRRIKELKILA